jgi:hypothetical protein
MMKYAGHDAYLLQAPLMACGIGVGGIGLAWAWSAPLIGGALLVLFGAVGCVWRRGEPPILAFCLTYQWLFIVAGYFYLVIMDTYPGFKRLGMIETAVGLSLLGLIVLVAGIRIGIYIIKPQGDSSQAQDTVLESSYSVERLCVWVVGLYTVNWFIRIVPMTISFDAAQVIYNILAVRGINFA